MDDLNSFIQGFETRRSLDKQLCPAYGRSASLGVNGGVGGTPGFCVMIGGSVERLRLLLIDSDFVL